MATVLPRYAPHYRKLRAVMRSVIRKYARDLSLEDEEARTTQALTDLDTIWDVAMAEPEE
jgi:hypothetical protein